MEKFKESIFCLFIFSLYLFTFRENLNIITNILAIAFTVLEAVDLLLKTKKLRMDMFFLVFFVFMFICSVSYFYARNQDIALQSILTLFQLYVLCMAAYNFMDSEAKIRRALKYIALSGFAASIYLLATANDFNTVKRLGDALGNENMMGVIISLSYAVGLYLFIIEKRRRYLLIMPLELYTVFYTGSRTAVIVMLFLTMVILYKNYIKSFSGFLKTVLIIPFVLYAFYYVIMNVPNIYNVLGVRIQNALLYFTGQDMIVKESSIILRKTYMDLAYALFYQSPLIGVGINNFRVALQANFGISTYAHSDFTELLADVGLIGTCAYYLIYVTTLVRLRKAGELSIIFTALIGTVGVVTTISGVMYYQKHMYIIFTLAASYIYVKRREKLAAENAPVSAGEDISVVLNDDSGGVTV